MNFPSKESIVLMLARLQFVSYWHCQRALIPAKVWLVRETVLVVAAWSARESRKLTILDHYGQQVQRAVDHIDGRAETMITLNTYPKRRNRLTTQDWTVPKTTRFEGRHFCKDKVRQWLDSKSITLMLARFSSVRITLHHDHSESWVQLWRPS